MQDRRLSLSASEIRELFSAYHDRELGPEQSEEVRKALEADPELEREYTSFCGMLTGLSDLGVRLEDKARNTGGARVDLLAKVQRKVYLRSRGKFYRDRWSRKAGLLPLELMAAVVLVVLLLCYFLMNSISVRPAPAATTHARTRSAAPARAP